MTALPKDKSNPGAHYDYYCDALDIMFSQFVNHSLTFPMVFPYVSPSFCPSTLSNGHFWDKDSV